MSFTPEALRSRGFVEMPDGSFAKADPARFAAGGQTVRQPVTSEIDLHYEIMAWCDKQYPRVKYIRARSDQRSTIAVGAQDFTLFLPHGRTLCIECKRKDGKLSPEQRAWHKEMEMLGHHVFVVRSMDEFNDLIHVIQK